MRSTHPPGTSLCRCGATAADPRRRSRATHHLTECAVAGPVAVVTSSRLHPHPTRSCCARRVRYGFAPFRPLDSEDTRQRTPSPSRVLVKSCRVCCRGDAAWSRGRRTARTLASSGRGWGRTRARLASSTTTASRRPAAGLIKSGAVLRPSGWSTSKLMSCRFRDCAEKRRRPTTRHYPWSPAPWHLRCARMPMWRPGALLLLPHARCVMHDTRAGRRDVRDAR
jgi:hypothetical protein